MTPKQRLDYFTGMALQGLLASADYDWAVDDEVVDEDYNNDNEDASFHDKVAETAIHMAKVLIKRLDKENL